MSRRTDRTPPHGSGGWPQRPTEGEALRGAGAPRIDGRQGVGADVAIFERNLPHGEPPAGERPDRSPGRSAAEHGQRSVAVATDGVRGRPRIPPFNLPRRPLRHASQCSHVVCEHSLPMALFSSMVVRKIRGRWEEKGRLKDRRHTCITES